MKIQHILVIMDPTIDEQPALVRAIQFAKKFDASIELFLVVHQSGLTPKWFNKEHPREEIIHHYLKTKQRWLNTYLSQVTQENISVSSEVRWHKPLYAEILKKVTQCHADIVIKSTHPHPLLERLLFTPNDWQLLKACPVPLLLAKSHSTTAYNNVMAAVDLKKVEDERTNLDKDILDTNAMMSEFFNAVAHVTHAYDPIGQEIGPSMGSGLFGFHLSTEDYQLYQDQQQEYHESEFAHLIEHYGLDEKNTYLVHGIASAHLIDISKDKDIDLLIMGVRLHSGFVGTTAENILDQVNCDILAIKPSY
ncbi:MULTISPECIES: universal stress protein [unclassified Colwellia]|uniref:universal stress protein n=1 Tax=unclassified Colwellia TaxID=196834 RepID=UPI0015F3A06B|nr:MULTISPECIES: universal stress protein [unclassified Colwellia]MBA6256124.1 universal stress protein [Colwellia sp. MB3u-28]MBA6259355.1 universal stress protein [Colwellia sp. MB3u-41]